MYDSYFGKPDRSIHYTYVLCNGDESQLSECKKVSHDLVEGRKIYNEALVAGVVCREATPTIAPPPCLPLPNIGTECDDGDLQLVDSDGPLEYCVGGQWTTLCHMSHNESTVACRQLGYTKYTCMCCVYNVLLVYIIMYVL